MTFWDIPIIIDFFKGVDAGAQSFGPIDHRHALDIMNACTLAFFEQHLNGKSEPLLDGPSPYAEVTFSKK